MAASAVDLHDDFALPLDLLFDGGDQHGFDHLEEEVTIHSVRLEILLSLLMELTGTKGGVLLGHGPETNLAVELAIGERLSDGA